MHVSPGNKHISCKRAAPVRPCPQKQKQWNPHYSTPCQNFGLACLPPKRCSVSGPPTWSRRETRQNDLIVETSSRQRLTCGEHHEETDQRRRETLDDSIEGARSVVNRDRSFSSLSWLLDCAITGMPSLCVEAITEQVHPQFDSIRLDSLTPPQYNELRIASQSSSSSLCLERSSQLGK